MVSPIFGVGNVLQVREEEADFARLKLFHFDGLRRLHANGFYVEALSVRPETNALSLVERSFKDTHQHADSAIRIEPGIEDQSLQRILGMPFGRRNALHDCLQHLCPRPARSWR